MVLDDDAMITVEELSTRYRELVREKTFSLGSRINIDSLNGLNFSVNKGDVVALIGRNGSGKSTLLKSIAGFLRPHKGEVRTKGRVILLAGTNPGFSNILTGRQNIRELATAYGIGNDDLDKFVEEVKNFTELEEAFERNYGGYSSGMGGKLGFSFISHLKSEILLIDETFGAGDREFRRKAQSKMVEMINESSTVILATHSTSFAQKLCNKTLVLDEGKLAFFGGVDEGLRFYNELTSGSVESIKLPFDRWVAVNGEFNLDLSSHFGETREIRVVIHNNVTKEFIVKEEFLSVDEIIIRRGALPENMDCKVKLQIFNNGRWKDATIYLPMLDSA